MTSLSDGQPGPIEDEDEQPTLVSALFARREAVQAALRELREVGIPAEDISFIARAEDDAAKAQVSGVSQEMLGYEGVAYRASYELPGDEDPPGTEADAVKEAPKPLVTDYEVPPDEPYGGSEQLGLTHNEGQTDADEDIYTDFPDEPSGIIGALSRLGLPEEYTRQYAAGLQQGQTLIAVRTDPISRDLVERVLVANGGENVYCA